MARPLRIEYAGAFYHVIHRGNAGEAIFRSKRDPERFLENVAKPCLATEDLRAGLIASRSE